ncbi:carbonic anhydrase [Nitrosomonas ureae]|uniref:carbonic anhydrase n=1 Tax=Nitrosomonas ureae TaxID=44577 RepID=A0A0S3AM69_9PROT|nr:carbonic anhydrase family protein [Nitrosomonas ureae]ALQ52112.1 carbonic anhydrase [Nitrosomonas ureae]PXX17643.1 carbonic anhydrase [Nitrosomonas ureae]SDU04262.1 carbonic anhydrase [Nitrosomonas ureae]SOD20638.1 carbonic anhydrase [Nitrosomonas ureae]
MNTKIIRNLASAIFTCYATLAVSAPPHWSHDEQATWWAIQDTTQNVPLNYPYADCGVGKHQSPIDLATVNINDSKPLNKLAALYDTDTPVFFNSGHGVQVNTSENYTGALMIGEESFPLIQFHFHEPSEHVVGGKNFPAELHYVHINEDGRIIVLAVAIDVGEENAIFETILNNTPHEEGGQNSSSGIQINPAQLLPDLDAANLDYYTIAGSLTTPPCSEGVQWYLLPKVITISAAQLEQLKGFYTNNARAPQGLNGRSLLSTQ